MTVPDRKVGDRQPSKIAHVARAAGGVARPQPPLSALSKTELAPAEPLPGDQAYGAVERTEHALKLMAAAQDMPGC